MWLKIHPDDSARSRLGSANARLSTGAQEAKGGQLRIRTIVDGAELTSPVPSWKGLKGRSKPGAIH